MPGHSALLLILAACVGAISGIEAECADGNDECMMSSMLLQTEKSMNKGKQLDADVPAEEQNLAEDFEDSSAIAKESEDSRIARAEFIMSNLDNVTSALQQAMITLGDSNAPYADLSDARQKVYATRDAVLLAVRRAGSDEDQRAAAPIGVKLTAIASDISNKRLTQAKDNLKDVMDELAMVSLPSGADVMELLSQPTKLPAEHIFYGSYCGQFKPPEAVKDCTRPPLDPIDTCCREHDVTLAKLYPRFKCVKVTTPDDGDKPDCEMYSKGACIDLAIEDHKLTECVKFAECPSSDSACATAKSDIIDLYGYSKDAYSAGETGCPAIPRFSSKHR